MNSELEGTTSSATNHTDDALTSISSPTKAAVLSPYRKVRSSIPSLEVLILSNNSKVKVFLLLMTHSLTHLHVLVICPINTECQRANFL